MVACWCRTQRRAVCLECEAKLLTLLWLTVCIGLKRSCWTVGENLVVMGRSQKREGEDEVLAF